jgi:hypothetical protein
VGCCFDVWMLFEQETNFPDYMFNFFKVVMQDDHGFVVLEVVDGEIVFCKGKRISCQKTTEFFFILMFEHSLNMYTGKRDVHFVHCRFERSKRFP